MFSLSGAVDTSTPGNQFTSEANVVEACVKQSQPIFSL